jgi:F0F1-type ATP synthase alpha subunit
MQKTIVIGRGTREVVIGNRVYVTTAAGTSVIVRR